MRFVFTLLICFAMALSGRAQERVRNVRIRVADSSQLEIRYDLVNTRYGDSVYFEVRSRIRGVLRISPEFVRGDFGFRVTAGSDRRILWNALANGYSLNEEIQAKVFVKTGLSPGQPIEPEPVVVQKPVTTPIAPKREPVAVTEPQPAPQTAAPTLPVKKTKRGRATVVLADTIPRQAAPEPVVVSAPVPQATAPRVESSVQPTPSSPVTIPADEPRLARRRYVGPAWALVSAIAPGIGNIFVQTPKPKIGLRPLVTVGCYGLLIYGFMERQKSKDAYAVYEQQKNMVAGEPYYKTANDHHHTYFMATRGALVVAAADVILTFIKGVRNNQQARRYQSVTVSPSLQAGQPTALVRYSF